MKKNLVLDIGTYRMKLIYGFFSNGFVVVEKSASMLSPEGIIENGLLNVDVATAALRYLLNSLDLQGRLSGVSIVESTAIVSRSISLPYLSPEDLNNMVHMEIQRLFSDVLQNYIVDYTCLNVKDNEDNTGKQADVMVFALPENIFQGYFDVFENCEVHQDILDVLPNSASRILRQRAFINEKLCSDEDTYAFLDIGHASTTIIIVSKGSLAFSRTLQRGGLNITEGISDTLGIDMETADKMKISEADVQSSTAMNEAVIGEIDEIISDIQRVFRYFLSNQGENGAINKIFIYGGTSQIANLDSYMSQSFSIPVERIDTLNFMNVKHTLPLDCNLSDFLNAASALMRI